MTIFLLVLTLCVVTHTCLSSYTAAMYALPRRAWKRGKIRMLSMPKDGSQSMISFPNVSDAQ